MANEQFFFSRDIRGNTAFLQGDEHFHLSRVLRKKIGDIAWLSNGKGLVFEARIESIEKDETRLKILQHFPELGEPQNRISLAIGLIKSSHWDILLEKTMELGVYEIFPLITRYTVKTDLKRERSEKILLSALKQCGRSRIPILHNPVEFKNFLQELPRTSLYICDNQADYPLLQPQQHPRDALVLVGPEGGFHPEELHLAIHNGFKAVRLVNRRLRSETAAILALSRLIV